MDKEVRKRESWRKKNLTGVTCGKVERAGPSSRGVSGVDVGGCEQLRDPEGVPSLASLE